MRVLAIETATTVCAAAVVYDGRVLSEVSADEKYVHAEKLMTQVDAVLARSELSLPQMDGIAVSIGPGSFTGLRIGLSVAKGLAFASDKRILPVPTLIALAQRVVHERVAVNGQYILAALDARRDEVYCQFFKVEDGCVKVKSEPCDLSASIVRENAPAGTTWVTGDARTKLQPVLNGGDTIWNFVPEDIARCSAGTVGLLGEAAILTEEAVAVTNIEPMYIKEFFFRQQS